MPNKSSIGEKGHKLLERFEIERCLGVGRTSTVFLVKHRKLGAQELVLKVLHEETTRDPTAAARFQMEILASYEVCHPNVIRSYEFIREGNILAFTMEFAEGGDLRSYIDRYNPIPIVDVLRISAQICRGLEAIHSTGIVHRDLKPQNIYFTLDGQIKIGDFGIARTKSGKRITREGEIIGPVNSASPEYVERGELDARSDIYAFGLLLYELITGVYPFAGQSPMAILKLRLKKDPVLPQKRREDCPEALGALVVKAMARDPEMRFQSTTEMLPILAEIEAAVPGQGSGQWMAVGVPVVRAEPLPEEKEEDPDVWSVPDAREDEFSLSAQQRPVGKPEVFGSISNTLTKHSSPRSSEPYPSYDPELSEDPLWTEQVLHGVGGGRTRGLLMGVCVFAILAAIGVPMFCFGWIPLP